MIIPANNINIEIAINALKNGQLIGLPTETVYGIGGDATNPDAIAKIYAAKNRPQFNPLISHICDIDMAIKYGDFSKTAIKIAEYFWPGPLTIITPRKTESMVCDLTCAGLDTIALRLPNHKIAQEIIKGFNKPIAAPSANKSGSISPTSAQDVDLELGKELDIIIDGGDCDIGIESTVIHIINDEITILRHGSIGQSEIENIAKLKINSVNINDEHSPKSPGMLLRHYSPKAKLFLNQTEKQKGEIFIGYGDMDCDINLSKTANLTEIAANLYKSLRMADSKNPKSIKIASIPNNDIGIAINDRLNRAAFE